MSYVKVVCLPAPGATEEKHEPPQSGQSLFLPTFEPDTPQIQTRGVTCYSSFALNVASLCWVSILMSSAL
jgi:hypothetical protein